MMKALVTGANGFIGSSVVKELLKDGAEVRVYIRGGSDVRTIEDLDIDGYYGDIRDADPLKKALSGCDTLFHLAAVNSYWLPDSKVFYDVNVEGTKNVLSAALECGVKKAVYTSSAVTLGYHGATKLANEEAESNLSDARDHYVRSKHLAEAEALKFNKNGLQVVVVNPTTVIGAHDIKPTPSGKMILDIVTGKMPGYFDGGANFVDVEDVACGHVLAAQKGKPGERYILGNKNMKWKEYYQLIADLAKVEPPKRKLTPRIGLAMGYIYHVSGNIAQSPPLLTGPMVKMLSMYGYFNCSKAMKELGMPQTSIKTTITKAINWYRENGYLKV
jgi:dihydroflavonol-4-reductase